MIERTAKAAWARYCGIPQVREDWMTDEDWQEDHVDRMANWPDHAGTHIGADGFRDCARAAIEEMREPTLEMKLAALKALTNSTVANPKAAAWDALFAYRAMIDRALETPIKEPL